MFLRKARALSILVKFPNKFPSSRNYSSALFISGNKGSESFSYISPHLDVDDRFNDLEKLNKEVSLRGMKINADELKETWKFYKNLEEKKSKLLDRRNEIIKRTRDLMEKKELTQGDKDELEALKAQFLVLKKELNVVKEAIWDVEDVVIIQVLKLPNVLDQKTPEVSSVLRTVGEPVNLLPEERKHHLDVGNDFNVVEYTNPLQYYLCNEAALFELAIFKFCGEILGKDAFKIIGSDFSRSLVVEGSGLSHDDPTESFILSDEGDSVKNSLSRLHLVGYASFNSFLSLHTKQLIEARFFPLRYFATGKQYTPLPKNLQPNGLFTVCQASAVHAFSMVQEVESEEYKIEFDNIMKKSIEIYDKLGVHYRIVTRSASELHPWESFKVSFEIWSSFNQEYVEVGFISAYGDFISKRLLITCQQTGRQTFTGIISGMIISVPRLIACVLEQNPHKLEIPEIIQSYMQKNLATV